MKTRKRYTDEFKAQAVQLLEIGKPVSDVAADLGISTDLLYRWRREGPKPTQFGRVGQRAEGEEAEGEEAEGEEAEGEEAEGEEAEGEEAEGEEAEGEEAEGEEAEGEEAEGEEAEGEEAEGEEAEGEEAEGEEAEGEEAEGEEAEAAELRRLRRELSQLKVENDILKKAALILGTSPQPKPAK